MSSSNMPSSNMSSSNMSSSNISASAIASLIAAAFTLIAGMSQGAYAQQDSGTENVVLVVPNVVLAVPNVALTFAPGYLAEDWGLFAKQGLNVKSVVIAGIGSANAVISGSADFAEISGATLTRAAARGQRMVAIVSTLNRPTIQIVLRKEVAAGFDPKAPLDKRVQFL